MMARRTRHIVSLIKSPPSVCTKPVNEKKPGFTTELSHSTPKSPQLKSNYFFRFFNIHFSSHEIEKLTTAPSAANTTVRITSAE